MRSLWSMGWLAGVIALVTVGCGSSSDEPEGGGPAAGMVGARGVRITAVDLYQAIRRPLMEPETPDSIPLIAGREGLLRVHVALEEGYDGAPVTARLRLAGGQALTVTSEGPLTASTDAALASTLNFSVEGAVIQDPFEFGVDVLQAGSTDNAAGHYPAADSLASVAVTGKANRLRVVLVPYAYGADGSNRVPDLSPGQVERIRKRFYAMYPVSEVEISVHEAVPWSSAISPRGEGWQGVGLNLAGLRSREVGNTSDVYYYAIFNPADSIQAYCGSGCVLGLTLLNGASSSNPAGNPQLRLALGVGFVGYSENTAAHELGHAHGREHAPCAPGNQIDGVDRNYPHAGANIGAWGYDLATQHLQDPARVKDIMSYCNPQFVSDYTYRGLHQRGSLINRALLSAPLSYQIIAFDGAGKAEWGPEQQLREPMSLEGIPVTVTPVGGPAEQRVAQVYRYDHLPGGWLLVPRAEQPLRQVGFTLEGQRYTLAR